MEHVTSRRRRGLQPCQDQSPLGQTSGCRALPLDQIPPRYPLCLKFNKAEELSRTYRGFVDDGGAGHDVIALGRLVGDSLGEGVVLHPLVELCSVFRYVEVSPQTLTSGEVEES